MPKYQDTRTDEMHRVSGVERRVWEQAVPPTFTKDREWLRAHIPQAQGKQN